jgi:uncharacterized membrane protein YidH (DUF202 family)
VTPRRWLAAGAVLTVIGLTVTTTAPMQGTSVAEHEAQQIAAGIVVVLGWAALALGIHRFGRLADEGPSSK